MGETAINNQEFDVMLVLICKVNARRSSYRVSMKYHWIEAKLILAIQVYTLYISNGSCQRWVACWIPISSIIPQNHLVSHLKIEGSMATVKNIVLNESPIRTAKNHCFIGRCIAFRFQITLNHCTLDKVITSSLNLMHIIDKPLIPFSIHKPHFKQFLFIKPEQNFLAHSQILWLFERQHNVPYLIQQNRGFVVNMWTEFFDHELVIKLSMENNWLAHTANCIYLRCQSTTNVAFGDIADAQTS